MSQVSAVALSPPRENYLNVAHGIKSWLRSQYANSIRERKRGAAPQDFDLIGT